MARCLFTVEHAFAIRDRGLVLEPGFIPVGDERFRNGDSIVLRKPDGTSLNTQIGALEYLDPNPRHELVVMIKGLIKEDVPVGTEVWSSDQVSAAEPCRG